MGNRQQMERITECSKHGGAYLSKFMPMAFGKSGGIWTGCPKCIEELDAKEAKEEARRPWDTPRRTGMDIGTYSPKNESQANAKARIQRYVENFKAVLEKGICLSIIGPVGVGKTHLAIGICNAIHKAGYSVHYERMYDLMRKIKDTYSARSTDSEKAIMDRVSGFDLMALDEVGLKNPTETDTALIHEIIDRRYEFMRPTIIVSNLNEKELEGAIGQRAVDRLYANSGAVIVIEGESQRRS